MTPTDEYTEPTVDAQPRGTAAAVVIIAIVSIGCLLSGIAIGRALDPLIVELLTKMFFGSVAFVAVLMVLGSFLNKVK